jgi:hypothetical protein
LKKGVEGWKEWREANPDDIGIDLSQRWFYRQGKKHG